MEYIIGVLLAMAVIGTTTLAGIGQGRNFYPIMLIVIAFYYVLFAVMSTSGRTVVIESAVAGVFILIAVIGFKTRLWFVAVALVGHGLFDAVHHVLFENAGVPAWWPGFCMAFDVVAGGLLAFQLRSNGISQMSYQPGAAGIAHPQGNLQEMGS